jgi:MFS family permease
MTTAGTTGVVIAAVLTMLIAILDSTIVTTTAVPITQALAPRGGTAAVPWLLAVYALASTVAQPLYGKLADSIGVRWVMLLTLAVFIAGSALCGFAATMPILIAFRALQGLGGGGLMSVTMVLIGHLRAETDGERSVTNGNAIAAAMVGLGLVLGPLVGGVIVNTLGWRWVFFVNVPLGLCAFAVFALCLRLPKPSARGRLELPSAGLLAFAAGAVIFVCQFAGHEFDWGSWQVIGVIGVFGIAVGLFVWRQRTAAEPFFPPRLLHDRNLRVVTFLQFASGLGMAAGIIYLTLELQLVRGATPIETGLQMLPVAAGLAIGAACGASLIRRDRPLRTSIALGAAVSALALALFALCSADTPIVVLWALMLVFGAGIGLGLGNEIFMLFALVHRRDLGVATTGVRFVETLGTALGATVFASVFGAMVPAGADGDIAAHAIDVIFLLGATAVALSAAVALRLPKRR